MKLPLFPSSSSTPYRRNPRVIAMSRGRFITRNAVRQHEEGRRSDLRLVADFAADRAEMHAVIGEQRRSWNVLLLGSLNSITLSASLSAGLAAAFSSSPHHHAFRVSAVMLYTAATAISLAVNYLQPSQLAEEQRNAARLFRQLERTILRRADAAGSLGQEDVDGAVESVLALDRAYPLALLGVMLEKFPRKVEPAVWWPAASRERRAELDETMEGVLGVIRRKDTTEFVRLAEKVLAINRVLAICGPLMTGLAATGSAFAGSSASWVAVVGGALAMVVNAVEHGGQMGMVFELYRNCAGYYRHVEEEIEGCSRDGRRELELKVALQLGRRPSELRSLADEEFPGKLF